MKTHLVHASLLLLAGVHLAASAPIPQVLTEESTAALLTREEPEDQIAARAGFWTGSRALAVGSLVIGFPGMLGYQMSNINSTRNTLLSKKILDKQRMTKAVREEQEMIAAAAAAKLHVYREHMIQNTWRSIMSGTPNGPPPGTPKSALAKRDVSEEQELNAQSLSPRSSAFERLLSSVGLGAAIINLTLASHSSINNIEGYRYSRAVAKLNSVPLTTGPPKLIMTNAAPTHFFPSH